MTTTDTSGLVEQCGTCRFHNGRISGRVYTGNSCRRYPVEVQKTFREWCGEYSARAALKGEQP